MISQEVQASLVNLCTILNSHNVEYLIVGFSLESYVLLNVSWMYDVSTMLSESPLKLKGPRKNLFRDYTSSNSKQFLGDNKCLSLCNPARQ
jgi:hypothetical protein